MNILKQMRILRRKIGIQNGVLFDHGKTPARPSLLWIKHVYITCISRVYHTSKQTLVRDARGHSTYKHRPAPSFQSTCECLDVRWNSLNLKKLSVLMVCTPVFIFTSGSSALLGRPRCGLSIWLSLFAIFNTLFWQNTKILEVRHFRMIRKWPPTVIRRAKH